MNQEIKNKKSQKGFTLVELIVVIAILGILAAVAVPNYMNYQRRSRVNTDISSAGEIIRAARTQIIETDADTVPSLDDLAEVSNLKPISGATEFTLGGTTGDNGLTVTFTPSSAKAGAYAHEYVVEEGKVDEKKASKN